MSWLGVVLAAVILCPLWLKVATAAELVMNGEVDHLRKLARAIYFAAVGTMAVLALLAVSAVIQWSGARPNEEHPAQVD